jgi:phenylacetate-CoA ligase
MRAYPSAAYELAKLNLELGRPIRFESVITSSETLYPFQRETIESAFGGRVFSGYGMAERVIYGSECEHGRMHVNPEYGIVEILDKSGCATNEEGLLVGTTLRNRLMPLLRYQLKDSARWDPRPCPCGRTYPVIQDLTGKVEDLLFDLDGQPVSPSVMTFAFKQAQAIQRAQVAQISRDRWVIRVVPDKGYTDDVGVAVLASLHKLVSARVRATVERVSAIPELPNGKYKWVSQEWIGTAPDEK